ncbi:hypothetical protein FNF29_00938 [Cafeteria roenbergensis]|uniref:PH domain-containing protein n=1 Tax=Cafeteria roenbergensis TaxID=33653 RepID=A0A5A8CVU4_CAFRO|nr:hypothetical protein FNF29_00938 [Cafeteria roenbergensis]|eukprot:KAA0156828.1 hypothetical protein FNF29_00938 [Cafeteria roenbergensis]
MADHAGWLTKKAVKTISKDSWKRRWVTLKDNMITYATAKGATPKALLVMTDAAEVALTTEHGPRHPHEFVVRDAGFTLFACGDSSEVTAGWVAALSAAAARLKECRDVGSEEMLFRQKLEALRRAEAQESLARAGADPAAGTAEASPGGAASGHAVGGARAQKHGAKSAAQRRQSIMRRKDRLHAVKASLDKVTSDTPIAEEAETDSSGEAGGGRGARRKSVGARHVLGAGVNDYGQLGLSRTSAGGEPEPSVLPVLDGPRAPTALACGFDFCLAATGAGVFVWGNGTRGQLGVSESYTGALRPFPNPRLRGKPVKSVACGNTHALFVDAKGDVYAMGSSSSGAVGIGQEKPASTTPALCLEGQDVIAVRAGGHNSAAITRSGQLYRWGDNRLGVLGNPTSGLSSIWKPMLFDDELLAHGVVDIAFASSFTLIMAAAASHGEFQPDWVSLEAGRRAPAAFQLLICGAPASPLSHFEENRVAFTCPHHTRAFMDQSVTRAIAGGHGFALVLAKGSVHSFGEGVLGHCTNRASEVCARHPRNRTDLAGQSKSIAHEPVRVPDLDLEDIVQLACGVGHCLALSERGVLFGWGLNASGALGTSSCADEGAPIPAMVAPGTVVRSVSAGGAFTMCVAKNGETKAISDSQRRAQNVADRWLRHLRSERAKRDTASAAASSAGPPPPIPRRRPHRSGLAGTRIAVEGVEDAVSSLQMQIKSALGSGLEPADQSGAEGESAATAAAE